MSHTYLGTADYNGSSTGLIIAMHPDDSEMKVQQTNGALTDVYFDFTVSASGTDNNELDLAFTSNTVERLRVLGDTTLAPLKFTSIPTEAPSGVSSLMFVNSDNQAPRLTMSSNSLVSSTGTDLHVITAGSNITIDAVGGTISATAGSTITDPFAIVNTGATATGDGGFLFEVWQDPVDDATGDVVNGTAAITGDALQAAASNSATLDAGSSSVDDFYNGWWILITSGSGINEARLIVDYDGTTKVALLSTNWTTTPSATDTYNLYDQTHYGTFYDTSSGEYVTAYVSNVPTTGNATIGGYIDHRVGRIITDTVISSTTNGDLTLEGDGTGIVRSIDIFQADIIQADTTNGDLTLQGNGTGIVTIVSQLDVNNIESSSTNANLTLSGNGTGIVQILDAAEITGILSLDTVTALTLNTNLTLSGNGTGLVQINDDTEITGILNLDTITALTLDTNLTLSGNGNGLVQINDGAEITGTLDVDTVVALTTNGNLSIGGDGTGVVQLSTDLDANSNDITGVPRITQTTDSSTITAPTDAVTMVAVVATAVSQTSNVATLATTADKSYTIEAIGAVRSTTSSASRSFNKYWQVTNAAGTLTINEYSSENYGTGVYLAGSADLEATANGSTIEFKDQLTNSENSRDWSVQFRIIRTN